jgi:hypothetical protein
VYKERVDKMKELKIDLREMNRWFKDRFPNKDLITFEELLADYEELILDAERRQEEEIEKQATIDNYIDSYGE